MPCKRAGSGGSGACSMGGGGVGAGSVGAGGTLILHPLHEASFSLLA